MTPSPTDKLKNKTHEEIDTKLEVCGWAIQNKKRIKLYEKLSVAVYSGLLIHE